MFLIAWMLCDRQATAREQVDYVNDVLPILETYCIGCHTADDPEGGLVMESHDALLAGGDSGPAITAGVANSSRLFLMAAGKLEPVMPPDDMEGPNEAELEIIAAWIDQGGQGPDDVGGGNGPMHRKLRVPEISSSKDNVVRPVTAIAISPDAQHRVVARFGEVTIDRIDPDGHPIADTSTTLTISHGKVNALSFSPDGQRLLIASGLTGAYGAATLFDLSRDELCDPIQTFMGHRDTLYAAELSPNGKIVATAGYDREIVLWDVASGNVLRKLTGHNGAIFDIAFSPDGSTLVSACADETVKVWNVASGQRLDTMSQSEGEVFAVDFTPDGQFIVAAGADNRLRVYQWRSKQTVDINPIVATRFVDPSRLISFSFLPQRTSQPNASGNDEFVGSNDSVISGVVVLSESGSLKVLRSEDWSPFAEAASVDDVGSDLTISPDGSTALVSLMDGRIVRRALPSLQPSAASTNRVVVDPVLMDLGPPTETKESRESPLSIQNVNAPVVIDGTIDSDSPVDRYAFQAAKGEMWAIDGDAAAGSRIDPLVTIEDEAGNVVTRVRLQAVLDSYFTFRGKNSQQSNDFRLFGWQEMKLNQFLYASGEVTRLWLHPRGPDSGFNVYPGTGDRRTYFGTTQATHALGEPAFIVQPIGPTQPAAANGLPVFDIPYQNDDDPHRLVGKNSRLVFTAPDDGRYVVAISDARGETNTPDGASDAYRYRLTIRAASPSFDIRFKPIKQ
ncbi:MAG: c-type cytochrome domain-containing protein, partial [Planctomycetota bacterium]